MTSVCRSATHAERYAMRLLFAHRPMIGLTLLALATPALAARPTPWSPGPTPIGGYDNSRSLPRGGKVTVARFKANDPRVAQLGSGPISVAKGLGDMALPNERAIYEAAILDRLAANGYTVNVPSGSKQIAEIVVDHQQIAPAEPRRSPISGGVSVGGGFGGGYRGTSTGIGIGIDLSKPKKALVSSRLQVRIRDAADNAVLWEGRAEMATYEGDKKWTPDMVARKLATTLFEGFPTAN